MDFLGRAKEEHARGGLHFSFVFSLMTVPMKTAWEIDGDPH